MPRASRYPIDEIPDDLLRAELQYRADKRMQHCCDYCGRYWNTPPCKFPDRHAKAALMKPTKQTDMFQAAKCVCGPFQIHTECPVHGRHAQRPGCTTCED